MAYRYKRADVEHLFTLLCKALGQPIAARVTDEGWRLDYYANGGGYVVEDLHGHRPFGNQRRNARDFCEAVGFALRVLDVMQGDE